MNLLFKHKTHFLLLVSSLFPVVVFAQPSSVAGQGSKWEGIGPAFTGFCQLLNWFFSFLLIFAVIAMLYAGFKFLTAGGDSTKVGSARGILIWAFAGVAVVFLGRAFVIVVGTLVGAENLGAIACGN